MYQAGDNQFTVINPSDLQPHVGETDSAVSVQPLHIQLEQHEEVEEEQIQPPIPKVVSAGAEKGLLSNDCFCTMLCCPNLCHHEKSEYFFLPTPLNRIEIFIIIIINYPREIESYYFLCNRIKQLLLIIVHPGSIHMPAVY